jgi:hypothetical protein
MKGDTEENARFDERDARGLRMDVQQALQEFHAAVGVGRPPTVEEIIVVGSTLRDDFRPGESDLDVWLVLDEDYEHGDGFRREMNHGDWGKTLDERLPPEFAELDCLGLLSAEEYHETETIRNPSRPVMCAN